MTLDAIGLTVLIIIAGGAIAEAVWKASEHNRIADLLDKEVGKRKEAERLLEQHRALAGQPPLRRVK